MSSVPSASKAMALGALRFAITSFRSKSGGYSTFFAIDENLFPAA